MKALLPIALLLALPARAAPVPVLHAEGTAHGFLVLRNEAGAAKKDSRAA